MSEAKKLSGLETICKLYGRMKCGDVLWVFDYANDTPVHESEMPIGSKRWMESERLKYRRNSTVHREVRAIYKETTENRRYVKKLRKIGASNYEIAKALGIEETDPVLQE